MQPPLRALTDDGGVVYSEDESTLIVHSHQATFLVYSMDDLMLRFAISDFSSARELCGEGTPDRLLRNAGVGVQRSPDSFPTPLEYETIEELYYGHFA